ncbi:HEPN domain-containing protein [Sodalis sp. RH14]|uniref:ApeA N-terminal domain 1-containing protein n=1 Tax=Sodalis sp. RH14 TaxID=3394329 RepID=UPI0039B45C2C
MDEINYYKDNISERLKGQVIIDDESYAAELFINVDEIKIRLFDFNSKINRTYIEMMSLHSLVFQKGNGQYLLFGLKLNESSFMTIGTNESFDDYTFFAQGFLYSEGELKNNTLFANLSIYGENIKKWSGYTRKLDKIIECGIGNKLPDKEDCVEFEKDIPSVGAIGLYYSYRYGGLNGLHTVGMSVEPHVTITFETPICLDKLIEHYIDLYMILRFFIGSPLMISNVKTQNCSDYGRNYTQFYLAEKKEGKRAIDISMLLPYSTIYRDDSENSFPESVWENYYNPKNNEIKELIKKYMTYSMIHDNEEKFLGFYRIIEIMTAKKSCYVDAERLSNLLKRSRKLLAKEFPSTSLSEFFRAIKRANKSKQNTESCIHHFIKNLPEIVVERLNIKDINISEICNSRNKIIHQPLFLETPEKIYKHMNTTEELTKLALLIRLGIPEPTLEEIINHNLPQFINTP